MGPFCDKSRIRLDGTLRDVVESGRVTSVHRIIGAVIIALFLLLMVWGLTLRLMGRRDTPVAFWATQHWTENILVLQTVLGLVMLLIGYRVTGRPLIWFHYLYGSLFPLIAVVGGRIAALRREEREYVGLAWGAFVASALTMRAVQTACGNTFADIAACFT